MKLIEIEQTKTRLEILLNREFTSKQIEAFQRFIKEIVAHSHKYNLVSRADLPNLLERHIADSLILEPYIHGKHKIIDLGSGAGLPGVPLAIMHPEISFCLVESRKKRANFLKHIKRTLKLSNVSIFANRIEELEEVLPEADCMVMRGIGEVGELLAAIKKALQPGLDIFILTSKEKSRDPMGWLRLKTINYKLVDSNWGGVIWQFTVPRETA